MRKLFLLFILSPLFTFSQLKDIKIIIPKELTYSYYDFVQFFPDEKFFVTCGNTLSVFNTETCEVIDEYDLNFGAKNLSLSADGNYISLVINNELLVFTFKDQKLGLLFKTNTGELIKGLPNSQYYGSLPIGGSFFTKNPNEIYVSIGSFTLLYDIQKRVTLSSHTFPLTDYIIHAGNFSKKNEAILAKSSGTISSIIKQSLSDLSQTSEVISDPSTAVKVSVRDSLLICFTSNKYFILNLETEKIVYEVRAAKYASDYYNKASAAYMKEFNKRPSITVPDTINFASDEYIFDIDFISKSGTAVFATAKGLKFIDLKTKKLKRIEKIFSANLKTSHSGNRMLCNMSTPYKAMRIFDPAEMKLISERPIIGNSIYHASISPNKRWLYTNGVTTCFLWDLSNFSKYVEIKDISGKDSTYINNVFFLNDSELVVNSGPVGTLKKLNLYIYNINKKKYGKIIKKGRVFVGVRIHKRRILLLRLYQLAHPEFKNPRRRKIRGYVLNGIIEHEPDH